MLFFNGKQTKIAQIHEFVEVRAVSVVFGKCFLNLLNLEAIYNFRN
jgi:hypothetical protein